jgi:thymidylate kinase
MVTLLTKKKSLNHKTLHDYFNTNAYYILLLFHLKSRDVVLINRFFMSSFTCIGLSMFELIETLLKVES